MKLDFDEKTKQSENGLITRSISDCYVSPVDENRQDSQRTLDAYNTVKICCRLLRPSIPVDIFENMEMDLAV